MLSQNRHFFFRRRRDKQGGGRWLLQYRPQLPRFAKSSVFSSSPIFILTTHSKQWPPVPASSKAVLTPPINILIKSVHSPLLLLASLSSSTVTESTEYLIVLLALSCFPSPNFLSLSLSPFPPHCTLSPFPVSLPLLPPLPPSFPSTPSQMTAPKVAPPKASTPSAPSSCSSCPPLRRLCGSAPLWPSRDPNSRSLNR